MQDRPAQPERPAVDLRRLVSGFLRMTPDMAIVGEVCDREARVLLSLSSGADVFTTISCRFGAPVVPGSEIAAVGPAEGAGLERLPTGRMQS